MTQIKWDDVEDVSHHAGYVKRARVEGGWIYRIDQDLPIAHEGNLQYGLAWTSSMCFVPDIRLA